MTTEFPSTKRSCVTRHPDRGSHERAVIESILDEGLVAHVGFMSQGYPVVIPMAYARDGSHLLLHGAPASRLVRALAEGSDACVSVTLLDGLVLARSAFHSSLNYRSVVLFGRCAPLESSDKARALERLTEHLAPGRWAEARPVAEQEIAATTILALTIDEATAKVRRGDPSDPDEDVAFPVWAGVIPLRVAIGRPVASSNLPAAIAPSTVVTRYGRGAS